MPNSGMWEWTKRKQSMRRRWQRSWRNMPRNSRILVGSVAKDMLANIFGGLMIQMDKPFSTGDWIRTTDKSIEGVVEKIGWRMTRIRTFNKNPLYVPNGIFSTIPIETPSRMTNREIYVVIGIRYDDTDINIEWPFDMTKVLLSAKDRNLPFFKDVI